MDAAAHSVRGRAMIEWTNECVRSRIYFHLHSTVSSAALPAVPSPLSALPSALEMTLLGASVKRVVRSATLARHTRTGCAHAGTRVAPERNARAFTSLRWSARNYPPSRDVSVKNRCMRDHLHNQHKLGALGVIGKKTRVLPNRGSPCRLRTRPAEQSTAGHGNRSEAPVLAER